MCGTSSKDTLQLTQKSFGFEWSHFSELTAAYERNFWESVLVEPTSLKGKRVLDAGCGAGRNTRTLAGVAGGVVGSDFSLDAVLSARRNTQDLPNVRVCVADILHTSLTLSGFDHVFCIGVLHHLPDPVLGFRKLVEMAKVGGAVSIWVYGRRDNALAIHVYEPIRKLTTRIPHRLLYWLAWAPAAFAQVCNWLRLPLYQHYSRFPFRTKWNDAFDVLSAPSARYYEIADIEAWYRDAGLTDVKVNYRMMNGKAKGIRAYGVKS